MIKKLSIGALLIALSLTPTQVHAGWFDTFWGSNWRKAGTIGAGAAGLGLGYWLYKYLTTPKPTKPASKAVEQEQVETPPVETPEPEKAQEPQTVTPKQMTQTEFKKLHGLDGDWKEVRKRHSPIRYHELMLECKKLLTI